LTINNKGLEDTGAVPVTSTIYYDTRVEYFAQSQGLLP